MLPAKLRISSSAALATTISDRHLHTEVSYTTSIIDGASNCWTTRALWCYEKAQHLHQEIKILPPAISHAKDTNVIVEEVTHIVQNMQL